MRASKENCHARVRCDLVYYLALTNAFLSRHQRCFASCYSVQVWRYLRGYGHHNSAKASRALLEFHQLWRKRLDKWSHDEVPSKTSNPWGHWTKALWVVLIRCMKHDKLHGSKICSFWRNTWMWLLLHDTKMMSVFINIKVSFLQFSSLHLEQKIEFRNRSPVRSDFRKLF